MSPQGHYTTQWLLTYSRQGYWWIHCYLAICVTGLSLEHLQRMNELNNFPEWNGSASFHHLKFNCTNHSCQCTRNKSLVTSHHLRQNLEAGHPRHPCCRTRCGSPVSRPAASSPAWSLAECPQRWSQGSLCWAGSLRGPRRGPRGKRTPVFEVRSKGPEAAAAEAQEDVRNSSSRNKEGKLCPPHT